jgi:hypothetical protein
LCAGGTLYSDEREMLDAERDYWRPRVAVHFGAKLLQWALFDFGQGIPRVLVVLNPTAGKQSLRALDMQATVDHEEFFHFHHGEGRRKMIERGISANGRSRPALSASSGPDARRSVVHSPGHETWATRSQLRRGYLSSVVRSGRRERR